jgi:hypothetical protein
MHFKKLLFAAFLFLGACSLDTPEHPAEGPTAEPVEPSPKTPAPGGSDVVTMFRAAPVVAKLPHAIELAEQDDVSGLRDLVEKHPRAAWVLDEDGRSALHHARSQAAAAVLWNLPMPRAYRNLKSPIVMHELRDNNGQTALHLFAREGRTPSLDFAVEMLCKETGIFNIIFGTNAPINARDFRGRTALHYAIEKGDAQNVKTLLSCRATNSNSYDLEYNTPLHLASASGDRTLTNVLLEAGAHEWARNKTGLRARHAPKP